jgi:carboxypeptidase D
LVAAKHSWHKAPAYTLYIDQPVGTGLSFTTGKNYPRNDKEVNTDFYIFLQSFFKVHADKFVTEQRVNRPFYFSGESHAGHYIPSMMAYILDQNEQAPANGAFYIPLSGAGIGNGWVWPYYQYAAAKAAYGHGIIDRAQMAALDEKEKECQALLDKQRYSSSVCFNLLDDIVGQSYGSKSNFKVSQYDIRKVESRRGTRSFPEGHKTVETYLGAKGSAAGMTSSTTTAALEAIHATQSKTAGQRYEECTNPPYDALAHQDGLGVVNEVVKVLHHEAEGEDPIRLLFFNGVTDLICNHVGNEILLEQLPWNHQEDWTKAKRTAWKSKAQEGDKISGYIKEFNNLLYLKLLDSGHMVPMDLPDVALDMMRLFMYGGDGAFQYSPQSLDRSADINHNCPSCPVCPTNFTNYDHAADDGRASTDGGGSTSGIFSPTKSRLWIGISLGAMFIVGLYLLKLQRSRYANRSTVASYDLEMRGGTYFDDPDGTGAAVSSSGSFRED